MQGTSPPPVGDVDRKSPSSPGVHIYNSNTNKPFHYNSYNPLNKLMEGAILTWLPSLTNFMALTVNCKVYEW